MPIKNRRKGNQPKWFFGVWNDAGGFIVTVDLWGRPHIKRIPPWQPDVARGAQAARVINRGARKQLRGSR
jgi:hypothetical protein